MERKELKFFESGFRAVSNCVVLMFVLLCGLGEITHAQAPAPPGWFSGDMHVHRSCGDEPVSVSTITNAMVAQNLSVVSLLADMGNGEVLDPESDLPKVNGQNAPESPPGRILRWDAEWHWDPIYFNFPHQALGGHIVALGLTNAYQLWSESTSTIFDWARNQGAISGFAHMQYLGDEFPQTLNCCIPIEYPVEVALGTCDFVSQDVAGSDSAMRAYYRLLNCGFRPGLAAGSDYPCNAQIGAVLTYVQVTGELTYRKWIDGVAAGRTVVSRNGNNEFLDLKVNGDKSPGDEIQLAEAGTVSVTVQWLANQNLSGTIELLQNGVVVASRAASVTASTPHTWTTDLTFARSGWLAARRIGVGGHQSHTAAVFVLVNGAPVRASAADALFYVNWMDELLARTAEGAEWGNYYTTNRALAHSRYQAARAVFQQIAVDAGYQPRPPVAIGNGDDGFSSDEIYGGGSYINAARFQAASNMTVSAIQAKVSAVSGNYKCAIYADNSGQPGGFLRGTVEATVASDRWQSFPLTAPQALTSGAFYWLAIWSDDPNARVFYSDNNGTLQWGQHNYGTWPDPLTTSGGGSHQYCIYASTSSVTLTNLSIAPANPAILINSNQSFVATGAYSDGSTLNLTLQVTWASSNAAVASINAAGIATGVAVGTAAISATLAGVTASTLLTVTDDLPVAGDYRSAATGNWSSTSTWQRFNGSSWVAAAAIPTSSTAGAIRIRSGHNVTVASAVTVDQLIVLAGGQLTVGAATLTVANGAGTDLEVFGTLVTTTSTSATISLSSGATVAFNSGATYQHARDGGSIPIATWHPNSTCLITGATSSTAPANLGQNFGHFTWNCASQGSSSVILPVSMNIAGDFRVLNTGTSGRLLVTDSSANRSVSAGGNFLQSGGTFIVVSSTGTGSLAVGGNFTLSGGTFVLKEDTGNASLNVAGDLSQTGGTFNLRTIAPTGTAAVTVNGNCTLGSGAFNMTGSGVAALNVLGNFSVTSGATLDMSSSGTSSHIGTLNIAGHFSHTGGTITETGSASGAINFNGTAPQNYTGGGTMANTIHLSVNTGATLMMGTSLVGSGSSGTFTLASGGTLGIGHAQGITMSGTSGNIRVTGTRSYSTSGSYIYNGTLPQVTGNGLPTALTAIGSLTIDNPAGVALSASLTSAGPVTVTTNGLLASTNGFAGPLTLNGTVAPGASVGSLNTGAQTWNGGATYVWELNNATGAAGSGYDRLNAGANAITIGASSAEKFTLKLVTLNGASPGLAANFNPNSVYIWTIASGGSLNGFAAEKFAIDASAFQNDIGSGVFRVQQSGGNLQLTFSRDVQITTTSLPIGEVNAAYSAGLTATGGPAPFTWSLLSGTLPPGLTLNSSGSITGTPTSAGIFNFTVQASDAGSPSATASRSFSIAVVLPSPILVLTNAANPFTAYYSEILLTEGLNSFALADASTLSAGMLAQREVVILGEQALTEAQVITLSNWVHQGGNLVALRPDKKLAGLLGLVDAAATLSEGYLLVNTASGPGAGIVGETMQFHGTADRYTLDGASNLATLYANASTPTANPAVTLRDVGPNGGQAAAFTYDLARSVVYTRQGNPAWEGQERDGIAPLRSSDLFFGNAGGDPQPDWVDFDKIAIPQADEQQRLLANLILQMNADRRLVPRFWYFPDGHKAAIVMTGDDHASNGTTAHFDQFLATSGTNTLVDEWKTIRSTSYIYPNTPLSDAAAAAYHAAGFEIGLHCSSGCGNYTANDLDGYFQTQLQQLAQNFPSLPPPRTHRMHCIAWSGYTILAEVGLQYGIRLDTSYYYWPAGWVQNRPGLFTGSGMAMRFATTSGNLINVYQAATQMTDESGQTFPYTSDVLLDRALGPEGYYGYFVANMHTDPDDVVPGRMSLAWANSIIASALDRGVPVISAQQLLTWLDGRNGSSLRPISSTLNSESFTVTTAEGARGLQVMVPVRSGYMVTAVRHNGLPLTYLPRSVKGMSYAVIPARNGSYEVDYALDTIPPAVTAVSPASGAVEVELSTTVKVTFSEPMAPASISTATIMLRDPSNNLVPVSVSYNADALTATLMPVGALARGLTYTVVVKGGVAGVKDLNGLSMASDHESSFTTTEMIAVSIWSDSDLPQIPADSDPNATELGLKFQSALAGYITGIRFYKGPANVGTHVGSLWTSDGTLLGRVTFTGESASGWQEQALPTPVPIAANTTYIVSYHAPFGRYSKTEGYFNGTGVTNYPLRALADGVSGPNGLYRYSAVSAFPNQTYNATHYWVDVMFTEVLGPDIYPPLITTVSPAPGGIAPGIGSTVKVAFNEPINPSTINAGTITLRNAADELLSAVVWYDPATFTATLVPDALLNLSETYTATVQGGPSGLADLIGNPLAAHYSWSFTVAETILGVIGNTNDGTATDQLWSDGPWVNTCRYVAGENWTVTNIVAQVKAVPGKYKCAIYADTGGQPGQLLRATSEVANPTTGWHSFPLTAPLALTRGQSYWLAIWSDDQNAEIYYSDNEGTLKWSGPHSYGTWPDPLNTSGGTDANFCIYASGYLAPALASIAVSPINPTIAVSGTQQFAATATYTDGSTLNVTSQATWISSNAPIATVTTSGLATGLAAGTTTIAATWNGVPGFASLTVGGQLNATVTLHNLEQVYSGTAREVTATTEPEGLPVVITYNGGAEPPLNAGEYEVIGTVNHPNYLGAATNTLNVSRASLIITANHDSKVYNGLAYGGGNGVSYDGFVNGETADVLGGTLVYGGSSQGAVNAGIYAIIPSGLTSGNYQISFVNGTLTVSPAALTVTADPKSKVYGAIDPTLTHQITSGALVGTDALTGGLTRVAGENVGLYAIQQGTLSAGGNYNLTFVGANLEITKAPLTVTADGKSKVYGTADPTLTHQITSGALVGTDTLSGALSRAAGENVGVYAINQGSLSAGDNYNLTFVGANLEITPAFLTVTADAGQGKLYGAADPALTYTPSEAVTFSGALARAAGEDVGSYAINQGNLSAGDNYSITFVPADFAITARPITVTADGKSKVYGAADPTLTHQITSGALVGTDTLSGGLIRVTGENVGLYAIQQGTLNAGDNYNLTFVGANLEITKAPLTVTARNASKIHDGLPYSGGNGVTYQGFANGENESVLTGTLTYGGNSQGAIHVGDYAITPGGLSSANYQISFVDGTLAIVQGPQLLSLAEAPEGTFTTLWRVHPGRDYHFQYRENLTTGVWTTADSFTTALGETNIQIIDDAGTNRLRFYRLVDVTPDNP